MLTQRLNALVEHEVVAREPYAVAILLLMLHRAILIVSLGALLAACGKSTIKPEGAEKVVVNVVSTETGFRPTDVRCPSDVEAKVGVTFECHFTGPEGPYAADMRITKVEGERVLFSVRSRRSRPDSG